MKAALIAAYRWCFARRAFYRFNMAVHGLTLRGIGLLNYEDDQVSGEDYFLHRFLQCEPRPVVLDVGANVGRYSNKIKALAADARIFAFEPHPWAFQQLQAQAAQRGYIALHLACGAAVEQLRLYGYADPANGSEHASLYREVIERIHKGQATAWTVQATTIDHFAEENKLTEINLLKIDTEGHELKVLQGAKQSIDRGLVRVLHFEFNEMNVTSRVFFRDFYDLLPDYAFYRMLPDGLVPLGAYNPVVCEIFAYQNIIAIHPDYQPGRELIHA